MRPWPSTGSAWRRWRFPIVPPITRRGTRRKSMRPRDRYIGHWVTQLTGISWHGRAVLRQGRPILLLRSQGAAEAPVRLEFRTDHRKRSQRRLGSRIADSSSAPPLAASKEAIGLTLYEHATGGALAGDPQPHAPTSSNHTASCSCPPSRTHPEGDASKCGSRIDLSSPHASNHSTTSRCLFVAAQCSAGAPKYPQALTSAPRSRRYAATEKCPFRQTM
jgi:hypothetical protein